ncbi:hypothetical protein C8F04DRAFT_1276683 [Mycena alexandri]|uniref:Uncharacterized protein n=1 Tax=Mycena alexandri TaxID=1745969 RepID=A0AAD6S0R8_9AGAR|nr:hypothetical protein C8F04DRAFT_1276683 [Mycena alexandri]
MSSPRTPAKVPAKQTRLSTKKARAEYSSPLIDDVAQESYERDFIDDGDQEEGIVFGTPELTPAPEYPLTQQTPSKAPRLFKRQQATPTPVIELDSSDEDLETMDVDDSMYKRPAGLKATALPPSLVTRSKRSSDTDKPQDEVPKKKVKVDEVRADRQSAVPSVDEASMERFMTAFMDKYMKSVGKEQISPAKVPRIDFDQLELDKGLAVSRAESAKRTPGAAPVRKAARESPEWDIERNNAVVLRPSSRKVKELGAAPVRKAARESPEWDIERTDPDVFRPSSRKSNGKAKELDPALEIVDSVFRSAVVDEDLAKSVAKKAADRASQLDGYVTKKKTASTALTVSAALEGNSLTMAQYFKDDATVLCLDGDSNDVRSVGSEDGDPPSTVFLEDLENYKAFYDQDAPCGVYDPDLQDPALAATYRKLPPLPGGRQIIAVYDPTRNDGGEINTDTKGGRAKFSSWRRHLKAMLAKNCIGAMLFVEASPSFVNLSRVSPLRLSKQAAVGASATQRLLVDGKIAICLSAVFCTESMIVSAGRIGTKTDRTKKWISGIFHNQDWERFESVVCLVFGEDLMYTQINNKKAVSFQTMISPPDTGSASKDPDAQFNKIAPADMFSPIVSSTPSKSRAGPSKSSPSKPKTLLAHNDFLPVYDARKTVVDFNSDLGRLGTVLPVFTGEIPFSSFVVVGYSVSAYAAKLNGGEDKVAHVGCNVLWAIVCGTPTLRRQ